MFEVNLRRKLEATHSIEFKPDQLKYTSLVPPEGANLKLCLVKVNLIQQVGRSLTVTVHMKSSTIVFFFQIQLVFSEWNMETIYFLKLQNSHLM